MIEARVVRSIEVIIHEHIPPSPRPSHHQTTPGTECQVPPGTRRQGEAPCHERCRDPATYLPRVDSHLAPHPNTPEWDLTVGNHVANDTLRPQSRDSAPTA